ALRRSYQPFPPAVAGMNRLISAGRYQLIVGRYLRPSVWCGLHHHAPFVLDFDDVDFLSLRSRVQAARAPKIERLFARRQLKQAEEAARRLVPQAEHVWLTSPAEISLFPDARASVLPNIP